MPNTLRLKSDLSKSEIAVITRSVFQTARSNNVPLHFDERSAVTLVEYVLDHEIGSYAKNGRYPTTLSNGLFAGILQSGPDGLIEANASTKNANFKKLRPISWVNFPSGIHPMYTLSNRNKALAFHKRLVSLPVNEFLTVTDSMVSIAVFLDTANLAYANFKKYLLREPSQAEVYMYHMFGWPKMNAWVRVKGGAGSKKDLALVKTMSRDLSNQSAKVQRIVGPILGDV